jgi:hypothetical protein
MKNYKVLWCKHLCIKSYLEENLQGRKYSRELLVVFKYNLGDIKNMCMSYWWVCNSQVPFTEEEIKRFIQKIKIKVTCLFFYVHPSTRQ